MIVLSERPELVEAERHVPGLAREDRKNGGELRTKNPTRRSASVTASM
jgi:hypothetical protein